MTAEISDLSVDGSTIVSSVVSTADKLAAIQAMLDRWAGQIGGVGQALVAAEAITLRLVDWASIALSRLFLLFGAGQLCLVDRAIRWLRA